MIFKMIFNFKTQGATKQCFVLIQTQGENRRKSAESYTLPAAHVVHGYSNLTVFTLSDVWIELWYCTRFEYSTLMNNIIHS